MLQAIALTFRPVLAFIFGKGFLTKDLKDFTTSDNKQFLVRD